MAKKFSVSVPASSGNIGPGFDVLGLALDFRNELHVRVLSARPGDPIIRVVGEGEGQLPVDRRNAIYKTVVWLFEKVGQKPPRLDLICVNRIPLARGLGSSSAAFLLGLLAANRLLGDRFTKEQILDFATALEGHPDNAASSLYGGVRACGIFHGRVVTAPWPVPALRLAIAIPEFELSTKTARKVLPKKILMTEAVANMSSVSLLAYAFKSDPGLLKDILNDCWHEPYRAKLIPGFERVKKAALKAGALGVTLSGAGPSMVGFARPTAAKRVAGAMSAAFTQAGVASKPMVFKIDTKGAMVQ